MPAFRTGVVVGILGERAGLQKLEVDLGVGARARAYVVTQLVGVVAVGDEVVVNTTAVDLGLGTGGWHFVHWNLARREWSEPGPGHIMKLRYTSLQVDAGSAEEHLTELADVTSIDGLPVIATALHSQLPAVAVAIREASPDARIAYVMTDGAALPLAVSDLVAALRERELLDATITAGHAFGGDHEAVNVYSALAIARHVVHADVAVVAMGPGIVGTGTALGFTGIEVGSVLDAAAGLGGRPIACLRASAADPRPRHRIVSHHSITTLTRATRCRAVVALPAVGPPLEAEILEALTAAGIDLRHEIRRVAVPDVDELFARHDLRVTSMGRPAADDPILFQCAAAAGIAGVNGTAPVMS